MVEALDLIILVLVGAFWGCTNPFLRKGALEVSSSSSQATTATVTHEEDGSNEKQQQMKKESSNRDDDRTSSSSSSSSLFQVLRGSISKFLNVKVWLPYVLNQSGSILFYIALSRSDLTLAVPICNALSLVFSIITSFVILGETVDKPIRAILGSALVMIGVGICVNSREENNEEAAQ